MTQNNVFQVEVGDTISVANFVYDTLYTATGKVVEIAKSFGQMMAKVATEKSSSQAPVNIDIWEKDGRTEWFSIEKSDDNNITVVARANPATTRQIEYLADLGAKEITGLSKSQASAEIERLKARKGGSEGHCHYCGQPAYKVGFFDEPVCGQCS